MKKEHKLTGRIIGIRKLRVVHLLYHVHKYFSFNRAGHNGVRTVVVMVYIVIGIYNFGFSMRIKLC